jgi:peptidyl-prolyl cis-trans isomerase D
MTLLFGIIIFVFAINFGPWAGRQTAEHPYAAVVNGNVITMTELRAAFANQLRFLQQIHPSFSVQDAEARGLKTMILNRLIAQQLLAEEAARQGFSVTDAELARRVKEQLFGDKPFTKSDYKRIVEGAFQTTEVQFEAQMKREILAGWMSDLVKASSPVSDDDAKAEYVRKNDSVSLDIVTLDPRNWGGKSFSQAEINAYAETHGPEIQAYYNRNLSQFQQKKKIHARHILVKIDANSTDDAKKAAKEKIQTARERVLEGKEDFATVAKQISEDSTTASKGGDLGTFGPGTMVKEFESTAFALKSGEISSVVQSPFGFHVIKVEEIIPAKHSELQEVKTVIAAQLLDQDHAKKEAIKVAEAAIAAAKKGAELKTAGILGLIDADAPKSEKLGSEHTSPFAPRLVSTHAFHRNQDNIPGFGKNSALITAAFATTAANTTLTQVFDSDVGNKLIIAKVKERQAADLSQFEAQKSRLKEELAEQMAQNGIERLLESLHKTAHITYHEGLDSKGSQG